MKLKQLLYTALFCAGCVWAVSYSPSNTPQNSATQDTKASQDEKERRQKEAVEKYQAAVKAKEGGKLAATSRLLFVLPKKDEENKDNYPFKEFAHVTVAYLGYIKEEKFKELVEKVEAYNFKELIGEHIKIVKVVQIGFENKKKWAFGVEVGKSTKKLIEMVWSGYGVLENAQKKKGETKGEFPSLLHITVGDVKEFEENALKGWIGTKLPLAGGRFDIKPLGPKDPVYMRPLNS